MGKSGICAGKDTGISEFYNPLRSVRNRRPQDVMPPADRGLLMDGTAVETFALLLTKVTKPPYPAKSS